MGMYLLTCWSIRFPPQPFLALVSSRHPSRSRYPDFTFQIHQSRSKLHTIAAMHLTRVALTAVLAATSANALPAMGSGNSHQTNEAQHDGQMHMGMDENAMMLEPHTHEQPQTDMTQAMIMMLMEKLMNSDHEMSTMLNGKTHEQEAHLADNHPVSSPRHHINVGCTSPNQTARTTNGR